MKKISVIYDSDIGGDIVDDEVYIRIDDNAKVMSVATR